MDFTFINKKTIIKDEEVTIKVNKLREPLNIILESELKYNFRNKVIELKDMFIDIEFINAKNIYIMIKNYKLEQIDSTYYYHITDFIISSSDFPNQFFKTVDQIIMGRLDDSIYKENYYENKLVIDKSKSNDIYVNFKEYNYYLDIAPDKVNVYKAIGIKQLNGTPVNEYLNAVKAYDNLIIGNPSKEDIVIYKIEDQTYFRFKTNPNEEGICVYSGCSKFTRYSFDNFLLRYNKIDNFNEICNEFRYFSSKEATSTAPERKLIFLRQIEYLFYFFKNDKKLTELFYRYNITTSINSMSNRDIIYYILTFYNLGEYDKGLFKKFTSISNEIDDELIEYIAEEVTSIRNGIAHINDKKTYTISYSYFDLISEVSYLMLLQYLGVQFLNQNAPTLHSGTKEPAVINIPKVRRKATNQQIPTEKIMVNEKVIKKEQTKNKKTEQKLVRKSKYKFFPHGYLQKLDNKTYIVKLDKARKNVDNIIKNQNIAIQLDGNVKIDSKLSKLVTTDADIVYSNANKKYKNAINNNKDKMIVFVNRDEIVVPKKQIDKFTHKNKAN